MKKIVVFAILILSASLFSCEKNEVLNMESSFESAQVELLTAPNAISQLSRVDQKNYLESHLKKIATSILVLISDYSIRDEVYNEIDKKFDGDNNVLVRSILTASNTSKAIPSDKLLHEDALKSSNAFLNIENSNYYPQIFIPYYDDLTKNGTIIRGHKLTGKSLPIVVFRNGGEENDLMDAYSVDKNGKLISLGFKVNEDYAKKNEVWVFSLNERVRSENDIKNSKIDRKLRPNAIVTSKIEKINVKVDYESWTGGASDVFINGWYANSTASPIPPTSTLGLINMYPSTNECRIRDVSDSELNTSLTINWTINDSSIPWNPATYGNYMYFAIYESDSWPTAQRDAEISTSIASKKVYVTFRGKDPEYWSGRIIDTQAGISSINNSYIQFNTKF